MATVLGRLPVGFPPADERQRCIWLGNRLETLTERRPCRRVPRLRSPAQPVRRVVGKRGGCVAGGRPRSARPEVRAEGLGCPSPALHGTSWVPGIQIVVQTVTPAELLRPGDISSRTSGALTLSRVTVLGGGVWSGAGSRGGGGGAGWHALRGEGETSTNTVCPQDCQERYTSPTFITGQSR